MGEYQYDNKNIIFGTGLADHAWTDLKDALPKNDAIYVYITGFTPFEKTIVIN